MNEARQPAEEGEQDIEEEVRIQLVTHEHHLDTGWNLKRGGCSSRASITRDNKEDRLGRAESGGWQQRWRRAQALQTAALARPALTAKGGQSTATMNSATERTEHFAMLRSSDGRRLGDLNMSLRTFRLQAYGGKRVERRLVRCPSWRCAPAWPTHQGNRCSV